MSSSLDRESFQQLLANAFALQTKQRNSQSPSAIVAAQELIAKGELDLDGTMRLIVECARNVANASGVAIGLLKGDQLVYRAGSGIAATYIEHPRLVTLTVSTNIQAKREILRVENSQTDARIEAQVCRQFGAKSLMMLLIYHGQKVAGVLEVLFSEPHFFQDQEVHAYQLMAGLVEEAILRDRKLVQKNAVATPPVIAPPPVEQAVKRISVKSFQLRWNVAAAGIVIAVVVASWIVHDHRHRLAARGSALQNPAEQHSTAEPAKPLPAYSPSTLQIAGGERHTNPVNSAFRRKRVGRYEVDYIAEDVTIRRFTPEPERAQLRTWNKQVAIGEDVTVRYVASPMRPVSVAAPNR